MMIVVWPLLLYFGYKAGRLSWKAFAIIVAIALVGTVLYDYLKVTTAPSGGDETFRWHPAVFAADVALTSTLYSLTYLAGFGFRRLLRRLGLDFHGHRPVGMQFDTNIEFFLHEIDYGVPDSIKAERPTLGYVIGDETGIMALAFPGEVADEGAQHLRLRLAIAGGRTEVRSWVVDAEPPLRHGDLVIYLPLSNQNALGAWLGPIIAQLEPTYDRKGYVVRRTFQ